ncbi:MAG: hypothetical protein FWC81_03665 [Coriobacteriia bacterium]|nr:hypothetical protein [Coriobacteriia bacterium]
MKAIDKSSSPLWVRILVWILVVGLVAAAIFAAVAVFLEWGNEPEFMPGEPIMIEDIDNLPPEILEQLNQMQLDDEQGAIEAQDDQ